jgi:PDDEXK-like domain of unknown function (DUF3799)
MKISEPGHYIISAEEYHRDPCVVPSLSASILKILLSETPQHAFVKHPRLNPNFKPEEKDKFDLGTAAHGLMLGDPLKYEILDFNDWRSDKAKNARDSARQRGKLPMLKDQWDRVQAMVDAGRAQLANHMDASDAFTDGTPEVTLIWRERGIWCRSRLDWCPNDKLKFFDDYKSTGSADPDAFQSIVYSVGHDIQMAFYRRGIRAVFGLEAPRMRFIVQEVTEPYALTAITLNQEAMDLADYKVDKGLEKWRWCMESNCWPAYPAWTCEIGPKKWAESQMLEREERDAGIARKMGVEPGPALLAQCMKFQSPF